MKTQNTQIKKKWKEVLIDKVQVLFRKKKMFSESRTKGSLFIKGFKIIIEEVHSIGISLVVQTIKNPAMQEA